MSTEVIDAYPIEVGRSYTFNMRSGSQILGRVTYVKYDEEEDPVTVIVQGDVVINWYAVEFVQPGNRIHKSNPTSDYYVVSLA